MKDRGRVLAVFMLAMVTAFPAQAQNMMTKFYNAGNGAFGPINGEISTRTEPSTSFMERTTG